MNKYIYADKFFLKSAVHGPGYLEVKEGKFGAIVDEVPAGADVEDYSGKWLAPGLVDTHIHGFMNHDVMDNDAEGIKAMSEGLLSCGVTSFLPTTLTSSKERLRDVAETVGKVKDEVTGAKIQGIYFEGPFFT
ncbi:MAG: amidohydrolase family protein, partial [Enterococcus sp.]